MRPLSVTLWRWGNHCMAYPLFPSVTAGGGGAFSEWSRVSNQWNIQLEAWYHDRFASTIMRRRTGGARAAEQKIKIKNILLGQARRGWLSLAAPMEAKTPALFVMHILVDPGRPACQMRG
jgi:hypothetical protein